MCVDACRGAIGVVVCVAEKFGVATVNIITYRRREAEDLWMMGDGDW